MDRKAEINQAHKKELGVACIRCYDPSVAVRPMSSLPLCEFPQSSGWHCVLPGTEDKYLALSISVVGAHCPCPDNHSGGLPHIGRMLGC